MSNLISRRSLLKKSAAAAALVVLVPACGPGELSCGDATPEQRSMRQQLGYRENWPDATRRCSRCNFFPAGAPANQCGNCTLNMGQVNPAGGCNSFAARA